MGDYVGLQLLLVFLAANEINVIKLFGNALEAEFECEERHFRCGNGSHICLPQQNNCDGYKDCPNGSDELNCDDKEDSKYYDNLFRKRPSAEHDDLDASCELSYNGSCECRSTDISCEHKGLERAPSDLPATGIDILDFTGNKFGIVSKATLQSLPEVVNTLVLQHCEITTIEEGSFYGLLKTQKLYLDNNHLKFLSANIFPEENEIEILTVRYNEISNIESDAFDSLTSLLQLDISYNKISEIKLGTLESLGNLTILNLQGNALRSLDSKLFPVLPALVTLSLEDNLIEYLGVGTFTNLPALKNLFLSQNKLRYLANGTFDNLYGLLALKLHDNLIRDIETGVFLHSGNLTSLDFRGNAFARLDKRVLKSLNNLKHIYFEKFEMCVDAPHVRVCEPKSDGISSQEHLLDSVVLRGSVWIMATIGCLGNLVVLLGRYLGGPTNNVVHSLYIKNLALSDLLMGVYLFTIAAVDHHYRGEYLQHQWRWRHSSLCHLSGFLNTLSCESSVFILSLVTWDRFVSVTQPLVRKQPSPKFAALTLIFLWMLAAAVAMAPMLGFTESYFGKEFYSSNGLCLPLYIHNPFANGWQYSVVMFMCINALALSFICYAYMRMIHEIKISGVACRSTQQSQDRERVAHRFGIIVLTDCLCWVPVIIVKVAAISGMQLSENYRKFMYASLAIYVLPINSALNPVLYTLTTTLFKKQMRRLFNSCLSRHRGADPQNSGYDSAFSLSLGMFPKGGSMRRVLTYRGTQSSVTTSKTSCRRPTPV